MEKHWTSKEALAHGRKWLEEGAGWAWKRGQVALLTSGLSAVVVRVNDRGWPMACGTTPLIDGVPDFRDSGTRGHALDQVREALGDPNVSVAKSGRAWVLLSTGLCSPWPCNRQGRRVRAEAHTESEALLAARRAA